MSHDKRILVFGMLCVQSCPFELTKMPLHLF